MALPSDVQSLFDGFDEMGWNDDSKLSLLAEFIIRNDLETRFHQFRDDVAAWEKRSWGGVMMEDQASLESTDEDNTIL